MTTTQSSPDWAPSSLSAADLIPDAALRGADRDDLDHDAVAAVLSDLARSVAAPANIALFGPWGSGKSSIFAMLRDRLAVDDVSVKVVRYDAWKFGGRSLQRNFLVQVADALKVERATFLSNVHNATEHTRLRLGHYLWRNKSSVFGAVLLALFVSAAWLLVSSWVRVSSTSIGFGKAVSAAIPSAGVVLGAVIAGLLLSNQTLATAVEKRTRSPLEDADEFSTAFDELIRSVTSKSALWRDWFLPTMKRPGLARRSGGWRRPALTRRLVVFIDELDRCEPKDVAQTLVDLKTFLDHDRCVFIVAADQEVLELAMKDAPQAKPVRENEPYYSTTGALLDKIFQHQLRLPPIRPEALTNFAKGLVDARPEGIWGELRADQRVYEDVIYALVPAHVRSPRRVKVLLNNFATNVRVIQERGIDWRGRAPEVAVLTVLQTEFPSVTKDLIHQPRLLSALVNPTGGWPGELQDLVRSYSVEGEKPAAESDDASAAPLLVDDHSYERPADERQDAFVRQRARVRLNQQLAAYLAKIDADVIPLPTLDLVYLQAAAQAEGLTDTRLASQLDFASDIAPTELRAQFSDASVADRRAAIRFLARKTENTFGASTANLVESLCLIAESLELTELEDIAPDVASTVLGQARNGRWRTEATPGAIMLGLLSGNGDRAMRLLGNAAEPNQLASEGFLDRVVPVLDRLDDDAAEVVHGLLGRAYVDHPEPMHGALRDLGPRAATRLWLSQRERIEATIHPPEADARRAATPTSQATDAPLAVRESLAAGDSDRYSSLLQSLEGRDDEAAELGAAALAIGLSGADGELYDVAADRQPALFASIIRDPGVRNRVVLGAITNCPTSEIVRWADLLETGTTVPAGSAQDAGHRVLTCVPEADTAIIEHVPEIVARLATWLDVSSATALAGATTDVLHEVAWVGGAAGHGLRREVLYAVLEILRPLAGDDVIQQVRYADIARAAAAELTSEVVSEVNVRIRELDTAHAAELARELSAQTVVPASPLAVNRLRICAAQRAALPPIPFASFSDDLDNGRESELLVCEWLESDPPVKDVQTAVVAPGMTLQPLSEYSGRRKLAQRSQLWVSAERRRCAPSLLRAIGEHGVNRKAVEHMQAKIDGKDLKVQASETERLVLADLSRDVDARRAALELAVTMLKSDFSGAGRPAAEIVVAAGGPGKGSTKEVRTAFDSFVRDHPNALPKKLRKSLIDVRGLTAPKKRGRRIADRVKRAISG